MVTPKTTPQAAPQSYGYPAVEALIDSENFEPINQSFAKAYGALNDVVKKKKGMKTVAEAKQAMRAIDRVVELFKELLSIKYELLREQGEKK